MNYEALYGKGVKLWSIKKKRWYEINWLGVGIDYNREGEIMKDIMKRYLG